MTRKEKLLREKKIMLISSVLALLILLVMANLSDPLISFADDNLEKAIMEKLELPLYQSNLQTITELDLSGRYIRRLDGLENLRNLVSLHLEDNYIQDLSPLAELDKLTELSLRNNEIVDLDVVNFSAITGLPLKKLSLRHNVLRPIDLGEEQIRLADISLIAHLHDLEELELRDNHIYDISPLSELANLTVLDLRENRITDITHLSGLISMKKLNLRENDISDLVPLRNMGGLEYLNIHSNENVVSIEPISNLKNLQYLIMRYVPIGDCKGTFYVLDNLKYLNIRDTDIEEEEIIKELESLGITINDYQSDSELALPPPNFSVPGGFYDQAFMLELSSSVPGVYIYYTLDGSTPSPDNTDGSFYYYKNSYPLEPDDPIGNLFTGAYRTFRYYQPIIINGKEISDYSIALINATVSNEPLEPRDEVITGTVVRAVAYREGYKASPVVTNSYFVKNFDSLYSHLPVISVVTNARNFFDYYSGIYVPGVDADRWRENNPDEVKSYNRIPGNYHWRGTNSEREVNLEIFDTDGALLINQIAGVRIHGGISRARPNKSLRFYARDKYGSAYFNVELFDDKEINQFKRFILRNSGNDNRFTYFRDALMQSLIKDIKIDRQSYQPSVMFINGVYWGIINIRDRIDRYYLQYEHGIDPYKIDLLSGSSIIAIKDGSDEHYSKMLDYIEFNDLRDPDVYEKLGTMMDIENYIHYVVSQVYFDNTDWPYENIDYWRLQTEEYKPDAPYGHDGRWRWIVYDTDFGFGLYDGLDSYKHDALGRIIVGSHRSTLFLNDLLLNSAFKNAFINTFADHLNTVFLPDIVIKQIDEMQSDLLPVMPMHIDRWRRPGSMDSWEENVEDMRIFARNRPGALREHIIKHFNLNGIVTISINNDFSKGTVMINTIDTGDYVDVINKEIQWSGVYFMDVPITIKAKPNEGYIFSGWEGVSSNSEDLSIILTEDLELTAIFKKL